MNFAFQMMFFHYPLKIIQVHSCTSQGNSCHLVSLGLIVDLEMEEQSRLPAFASLAFFEDLLSWQLLSSGSGLPACLGLAPYQPSTTSLGS